MRTLSVLTVLFWCAISLSVEPIPDSWTNNPVLGKVYVLKNPLGSLKKGERVSISCRRLSDTLRREEPKKVGLLVVGGKQQDDPGIEDATVSFEDAKSSLILTSDDAPLTHWQLHHRKFGDSNFPNIKPNYWYHNTFPINVYPATKYTAERPRLLLVSDVYRFLAPSPHCKKDEFTIRLQEHEGYSVKFHEEKRELSPPYVLAGPWYGSDYCVPVRKMVDEGPSQYKIVDPSLPDQMEWDAFVSAYHVALGQQGSETLRVSPFSEEDKKSGRTGPSIKVTKNKEGWTAEYGGPLYYACAGGSCRVQGYQIVLDEKGSLVRFSKNHLYYWDGREELPLKEEDLERLMWISNDKDQLAKVYDWASNDVRNSYSAGMSRLSKMNAPRQAGNSYGTFVIHLSKIREALKLTDWPIYEGSAPGAEEELE